MGPESMLPADGYGLRARATEAAFADFVTTECRSRISPRSVMPPDIAWHRFKPGVLDGPWRDRYLSPLSAQSPWTKPSRESRL
jgi:hypothetical protein